MTHRIFNGTTMHFVHIGEPITRSAIEAVQASRVRQGKPPASADEVTQTLVSCPKPRHYRRVRMLMKEVS